MGTRKNRLGEARGVGWGWGCVFFFFFFFFFLQKYKQQCAEMYLLACVPNEDLNQPQNLCSQIGEFVSRIKETFNRHCAPMFEDVFTDIATQTYA